MSYEKEEKGITPKPEPKAEAPASETQAATTTFADSKNASNEDGFVPKSKAEYVDLLANNEMLKVENKDPNRTYRWVDLGRQGRVQKMKRDFGYRIEKKGGSVSAPKTNNGDADPDIVVNGDSVLMSCPKEEYEKREEARTEISHTRLERFRKQDPKKFGTGSKDIQVTNIRNENER